MPQQQRAKGRDANKQVVGTRPSVPDDFNHLRPYPNWQPGKPRPFVPQHNFQSGEPSHNIGTGPGKSVGGKLNGIENCSAMNSKKKI